MKASKATESEDRSWNSVIIPHAIRTVGLSKRDFSNLTDGRRRTVTGALKYLIENREAAKFHDLIVATLSPHKTISDLRELVGTLIPDKRLPVVRARVTEPQNGEMTVVLSTSPVLWTRMKARLRQTCSIEEV